MFPLAVGVVMALFTGSAIHAAHKAPSALNKKFFWAAEPRDSRVIFVESEEFKQLKENEIKRAIHNKAMLVTLKQGEASVEELQAKLKLDENLVAKSIALFAQLKKQKKVESPKYGYGYTQVEPIFNKLNCKIDDMRIVVGAAQRKVLDCTLRKASISEDTAERVLSVLTKIQEERLALFTHFKIDANLQEKACTSYHMSAFPHALFLDAQCHDLQKNILHCF